jgi:acetyltransferase-like isoleucine patch superfamily enzyme
MNWHSLRGLIAGQLFLFPRLNIKRLKIYGRLRCRGKKGNIEFGRNVVLYDDVTLVLSDKHKRGELKIGDRAIVETGAYLNTHFGSIHLEADSFVGVRSVIQGMGGVTIGQRTMLGPQTQIYSSDHNFSRDSDNYRKLGETPEPVFIGENVWLGANCIVLRGTTIGKGAVIGAGATIKGNIQEYVVVTKQNNMNIRNIH